MAKSIYELINSKAFSAYWQEMQSNRIPYLGEALFPNKKKLGLKLEWIKGFNQLPVALMPSAFDAKPTIRDRIGVKEISTKMPFFRESMRVGEEDRQQLLMMMEVNKPYINDAISRIFDDVGNLVSGALVQPERMRMSLLVNGSIDISAPSDSGVFVDYKYNYDPAGEWAAQNTIAFSGSSAWVDYAGSKPITDLITAKRYMGTKYGVQVTRGIMTTATWLLLMENHSIKNDMNVSDGQKIILTDADMQSYLLRKTGISFTLYDKMYKKEDGTDAQFYPDNYITLLPSHTLGDTYYGTTPEEADLMHDPAVDVSIVHTGIAVLTKKESLPVNVITSVSEIVLPSFEQMHSVYVMKVA